MNKIYVLLLLLITGIIDSASAQLVNCRPRMCMIYYWGHDDSAPNPAMLTIQAVKPDFLIDNTPGGLWGGGCLPARYAPLGIKVFSYIAGGYENTWYGGDTSTLAGNLARIAAIKNDGAYGVFLDEVSHSPDPGKKAYIAAIYAECQTQNLKLILNTGYNYFDPWLMNHCDYILTDEHYNGRPPTMAELPFLDRVLVVAEDSSITDTQAAIISLGARTQGFAASYACVDYREIPSWIQSYNAMISNQLPDTPVISQLGIVLKSSAPYGNQWYDANGAIAGQTSQIFIPPNANASYYVIVTLDSCASAQSNTINIMATGIQSPQGGSGFAIYPNPAAGSFTITNQKTGNEPLSVKIYNYAGVLVKAIPVIHSGGPIAIGDLAAGCYTVMITSKDAIHHQRLIVQ